MKKFITPLLATTLILSSCDELENICGIGSEDVAFSQTFTNQLNTAVYIYQQADVALRDSVLQNTGTAVIDGALCTRTSDSIVIDFQNGTTGADGILRSGSIRMGYTGNYEMAGFSAGLKLVNFKASDQFYTGEINVANISATPTQPEIEVNVLNLAADSVDFSAQLVANWATGFDTKENTQDDVFNLSGNAKLTNTSSSEFYTGYIDSPIEIATACDYLFVGGMLSITPSNPDLPEVSLDFVDGDCANLFLAKFNCEGNTFSSSFPIQ